ncbi:COMM domain-containing protein 5-like [Trichosurus vulpecula]|uniref:COMM domain-containing protein 5-like n=1 Tax=Trichosurus vulpecula TaxID=9337 RepID=UPI00186B50D4|nr:COMM domain-containing protein 5-like [Trichosurus vulpecula]
MSAAGTVAGRGLKPAAPYLPPAGDGQGGRGSFLGPRPPAAVEAMARQLRGLDKDLFRQLLKVVVSALQGEDCREATRRLVDSSPLSESQLGVLVAGMYALLREALRLPASALKPDVFREDLQQLQVPDEFVTDFASVVFSGRRPDLAREQGARLPTVQDFRWRVDVAISTSSLARSLQPSILMQLKLSDGQAHRFEVPVAKFQELRYNVALILKEMNDLEKRCVLKIQD